MQKLWNEKGKKIVAVVMALLLFLGVLPVSQQVNVNAENAAAVTPDEGNLPGNGSTAPGKGNSSENESTTPDKDGVSPGDGNSDLTPGDGENTITLKGSVFIVNENGAEVPYQGAKVTLSGVADVEGMTDESGAYSFADITVKADSAYQITVTPKTEDLEKYEGYQTNRVEIGVSETNGTTVTADKIILSKKQFQVLTAMEGEETGEVSVSSGSVSYGEDCVVMLTPGEGKQICTLTVTGADGSRIDVKPNHNDDRIEIKPSRGNAYICHLKNITEDKTISVKFGSIELSLGEGLEMFGISVTDKNDTEVNRDGNIYYFGENGLPLKASASSANEILLPAEGTTIEESGYYGLQQELPTDDESSFTLQTFYIRDTTKFGTVHQIKFNEPIQFVKLSKPGITLSNNTEDFYDPASTEKQQIIWKDGNCTEVTISGEVNVSKENRNKVVCSVNKELSEDIIRKIGKGEYSGDTDNKLFEMQPENLDFQFAHLPFGEAEDEITFYFYVIDKANQYAEASADVRRDKTDPEVTGITINTEGVTKRSFGNFYNSDIAVTIGAQDVSEDENQNGILASGLQKIVLEIGNKKYTADSEKINNNGEATFQLSADIFQENGNYCERTAVIKVIDHVGNTFETSDFRSISEDLKSNEFMIENKSPEVSFGITAKENVDSDKKLVTYPADDTGSQVYTNKEPVVMITPGDGESGLQEIKIGVNEQKVYTEKFSEESSEKISSKAYHIDLSDSETIQKSDGGQYNVTADVLDHAGNRTTADKTILVDTFRPEITGFQITKVKTNSSVTDKILHFLSFGTFFNCEVTVKVTAEDPMEDTSSGKGCPSSGVKQIKLYLEKNGNVIKEYTSVSIGQDGSATFSLTLPRNAIEQKAGQIYLDADCVSAQVWDNVENASGKVSISDINQNVPDNGLMIEDKKPVIEEIAIQTAKGLEVYDQIYVNQDVTFSVKAKDNESGLYKVRIKVNDEEQTLPQAREFSDSLVKEYSCEVNTANVKNKPSDGRYTVFVEVTDNAGNTESMERTVYIDEKAPIVTGFEIDSGNNKNYTNRSFGNFYNKDVSIHITFQDVGAQTDVKESASGVKEMILTMGDRTYTASGSSCSDGTATFRLSRKDFYQSDGSGYQAKDLELKLTDYVGNSYQTTDLGSINASLSSNVVMIENVKPTVSIMHGREPDYTSGNDLYFSKNAAFQVVVADTDSGLQTVTISSVDGKEEIVVRDEVFQDKNRTAKESYKITTKELKTTEEGYSQISVNVMDNAGNTYTTDSAHIYVDKAAPKIEKFTFQAVGNQDMDGLPYKKTDYGYYFKQDTRVTVYATDGEKKNASGLKEIRYYTQNKDGVKSQVNTKKTKKNGTISFTVKAGFKGQIFACAYDNVNNEDGYVKPGSMIIETQEQHAKETHVTMSKADTPYRDSKGGELYASDVSVGVTITDSYSGIRKVEWRVEAPYDQGANQGGMLEIDNSSNFTAESSSDGWNLTKKEENIVTELTKTFVVSNNSNDIVVWVKMTDRAGHSSEQQIRFSIDKTAPVISIAYDNENPDAVNTDMYKENRIATITVTERNFDPDSITAVITNTDGPVPVITNWETVTDTGNPDANQNIATLRFEEDGDYTLELSGYDRARNPAKTIEKQEFTIDKTIPVIEVTFDNENAVNGNYFAAARTATIRIEEHNFSEDRIEITGTASDDGAQMIFPQAGSWTTSGDVHTASISLGQDGLYQFDIAYTDMAGNEAEPYTGEEFYVDMTEPEIEISGVSDQSANNGDVIPVIHLSDTNYDTDGVSIELTGANHGRVQPEGTYASHANGQTFTFVNFPMEQEADDIYTLTATLTDKAGNESTDTITFSVNRFGSVYVLDDAIKKIGGTYIQKEVDVKITETNADKLRKDEKHKRRIIVDTNGTPRNLMEGTDYTVRESGGNGTWYRYDYVLDKSLFAGDGRYIVTLYSEDEAGNINENSDESKKAEISFGVDKTAPVVIPIDIESNADYAQEVKSATVTVNDNLVLEQVEVYIGKEKCEYQTDGDAYTFLIPSASKRQDITIKAADAAQNSTEYVISGVLVTTNAFIRWINNKPLFAGSLAGIAAVGGGCAGLVMLRRRRKKANPA